MSASHPWSLLAAGAPSWRTCHEVGQLSLRVRARARPIFLLDLPGRTAGDLCQSTRGWLRTKPSCPAKTPPRQSGALPLGTAGHQSNRNQLPHDSHPRARGGQTRRVPLRAVQLQSRQLRSDPAPRGGDRRS